MLTYGLNSYYPNIPMVDNKNSVREFSSLSAISTMSGMTKTNENYYDSIKNSFNKIYSVSNIRKDAKDLSIEGKNVVSQDKNGLFQSKTAISSDDAKVTANANKEALNKTYNVEIKNTATHQLNKSNAMNASEKSTFNPGENTFTISSNGKSKDISFKVEEGQNNEQTLNSMAYSINNSNFGIKASITKDSKSNSVYLSIYSNETGKNSSFSLIDKTGNAISSSNAANKTQDAKDANYSINGTNYTSKNNNVTIDRGKVTLNLKESTTGEVKITVKRDNNKIREGIENFVDSYNKFTSDINRNDFEGNVLKSSSEAIKRNENRLKSIGVTVNEDKTLSIDKEKLNNALENNFDKVKSVFSGYTGIGNSINNTARNIERNPLMLTERVINPVYNSNYTLMQYSLQKGNLLNLNV